MLPWEQKHLFHKLKLPGMSVVSAVSVSVQSSKVAKTAAVDDNGVNGPSGSFHGFRFPKNSDLKHTKVPVSSKGWLFNRDPYNDPL